MFDAKVEEAVRQLWVDPWNGDGEKAKKLLEEAAEEGNGDACFFLGRCYLGESFIMPKFGFEENEKLGMEYFNKSIELGSAIGIFGARRLAGFRPRCGNYIQPPFQSLKDVWDSVNALAEEGQVFCQYLLANAYYYGDCIEMMEIPEDQVDMALIQSFQKKAIAWYEKTIEKKLNLGIGNLIDILSSGDYGIEKDPQRVQELIKIGATLHHPYYECEYATQLEDTDIEEALKLYEKSILHGGKRAYYNLGNLYTYNGKLPMDLHKAIYYYKKGLEEGADSAGCNNGLGEIYFTGGDGIEVDYEKAVVYFKQARNQDNTWCSPMLGQCYLKGLGTPVDYEAARREFMETPEEELSAVGLGEIYCYGLGVKANPDLGMTKYILPHMDNQRVQEICEDYKTGKIGGRKSRVFTLAIEFIVCTIVAMLLCFGAKCLVVDIPGKVADLYDTTPQVEEIDVKEGAVGTEYVDGIAVLTSYEEVVASKDVFVLSMDNIADYDLDGDEQESWCVAFFDGKYIPVKYNSYAATKEYSPIGKLVKSPSGKAKKLKKYAHYDESAIEKDFYIDMDGGMGEKQKKYKEEVQESELQSYQDTVDKQQEKEPLLGIIIILAWFPMTFVLHLIGVLIGLFHPVFQMRSK